MFQATLLETSSSEYHSFSLICPNESKERFQVPIESFLWLKNQELIETRTLNELDPIIHSSGNAIHWISLRKDFFNCERKKTFISTFRKNFPPQSKNCFRIPITKTGSNEKSASTSASASASASANQKNYWKSQTDEKVRNFEAWEKNWSDFFLLIIFRPLKGWFFPPF